MKKLFLGISLLGLLVMPIISSNAFTAKAATLEIPDWVANTKVKGDFRFRYQTEDAVSGTTDYTRNRYRIRMRLGVESTPNDQWTVGFGLATGKDANSGNQTLGGKFNSKDFYLDYAFAQYQPMEPVQLVVGKFKNPIWSAKDLTWDGDINPEGLAAKLKFKASDGITLFLTPAYFVFDEVSYNTSLDDHTADPNVIAVQGGIDAKMGEAASAKFAAAYYQFSDIVDGTTQYDADAWTLDGEVGITGLPVFVAVFGQYSSLDVDGMSNDDNKAYLFGAKVGDKKISKAGDWELKYNYRKLETGSWVNTTLGDSDFLGGNKAGKGSEVELNVGVAKHVSLGLDYYNAKEDKAGAKSMDVIQLDVNVKFP